MGLPRIIGTVAGGAVTIFSIVGTTVTILSTRPEVLAENAPVWSKWLGDAAPAVGALASDSAYWGTLFLGLGTLAAFNVPWRRLSPWRQQPMRTASIESALRIYVGQGDPFRGAGVLPSDADWIYRIAVDTLPGHPVQRVKVTIQDCDPPGAFALHTPMRLMHGGYDLDRGFDLDGAIPRFPELLDVWTKNRRNSVVQPAHGFLVPPRQIRPGVYRVRVLATGDGVLPCSQDFRITIRARRTDPVTIEAI